MRAWLPQAWLQPARRRTRSRQQQAPRRVRPRRRRNRQRQVPRRVRPRRTRNRQRQAPRRVQPRQTRSRQQQVLRLRAERPIARWRKGWPWALQGPSPQRLPIAAKGAWLCGSCAAPSWPARRVRALSTGAVEAQPSREPHLVSLLPRPCLLAALALDLPLVVVLVELGSCPALGHDAQVIGGPAAKACQQSACIL